MSMSDYFGNNIINHMLRNQAFTPPTTVYLSLHTSDPGITGASEVTGGSYARQAVELNAAASKATSNTNIEDFVGMPAVTVTHGGIWDTASAGNFFIGGALTASKVVNSGDTFRFPVSDVDYTLS